MEEKQNQAPTPRKGMYFAGLVLVALGAVMVVSVLFSIVALFVDLNRAFNPFTLIVRGPIALLTYGAGRFLMKMTREGGGLSLNIDHEQAFKEMEQAFHEGAVKTEAIPTAKSSDGQE